MSARLQEIMAGPWVPHAQGDADEYCLLTCADKWVIAFRINGEIMTAEQVAIAKLIAAAPALLAGFKEAAIDLEYLALQMPVGSRVRVDLQQKTAAFRAVIANAEGKS